MRDEDDGGAPQVEKFHPTSGRVTGVLGLAVVALVVVIGVVDAGADVAPWLITGCVFLAVLIWVVLLRPDARVEGEELVLRGQVDTRRVSLVAIDHVAVGAVLVVSAEGQRFTNSGIGRSRRQARNDPGKAEIQQSYGAFIERRITALAEEARLRGAEAGPVRRTWAWPEIAALVVTGLAFLATLVL